MGKYYKCYTTVKNILATPSLLIILFNGVNAPNTVNIPEPLILTQTRLDRYHHKYSDQRLHNYFFKYNACTFASIYLYHSHMRDRKSVV